MAVLKEICGDCVEITRAKHKNGIEFARQSQELRKIRSNQAFLACATDGKSKNFDQVLLYSFILDRFIRSKFFWIASALSASQERVERLVRDWIATRLCKPLARTGGDMCACNASYNIILSSRTQLSDPERNNACLKFFWIASALCASQGRVEILVRKRIDVTCTPHDTLH